MNNETIITAIKQELYNLAIDDLVDINNDYVDCTGNGTAIFHMENFDDEFHWYSNREIFELGQQNYNFDFDHDYFTRDDWDGTLESFNDPEFDFDELAEWMLENDKWYGIDITEIKKEIKKQELADKIETMLTEIIEDNLTAELGVELVDEEQFNLNALYTARNSYITALVNNFKIEGEE